ncbi:IS3 family transposase [Enterococcus faecalis]
MKEEVNKVLFSYIEGVYNRNQIHSSINYLTPHEFEYKKKLEWLNCLYKKCV